MLLLKPYLLAKSNGGEISLIEYLNYFQNQWGWQCSVEMVLPKAIKQQAAVLLQQFGVMPNAHGYTIDGLQCSWNFSDQFHPHEFFAQKPVEDFFLQKLEEISPDGVWAHYTDFFALTAAMKWKPERLWVHQTDDEYPRLSALKRFESIYPLYEKVPQFLVASEFMQKSVSQSFPKAEVQVLRRIIHGLDRSRQRKTSEYFLFVNPIAVKGVGLVLELAKQLPHEKFLVVGNWTQERPAQLPANMKFVGRQKNMNALFEHAKALLMPSVWQEAFGRLPLEAMAAGVPVISSDRGALPQTVGSGGMVLPLELELWVKTLQDIERRAEELISAGYQRVKDYKNQSIQSLDQYRQRVENKN